MVEVQRHAPDLGGKGGGPFVGAVGDDHAAHAARLQTARGALADLTGSEDHDAASLQ